jgi:hypothetical protein
MYRSLLKLGYVDAFRSVHPNLEEQFTFWDYCVGSSEGLGLLRNLGKRLCVSFSPPESSTIRCSDYCGPVPTGGVFLPDFFCI